MRRLGLTLVAVAIAVFLVVPATSSAQDRVIVEWAAGASASDRRAAREEADVDFARDLGSRRFQLVEPESGQAPQEAVRELEAEPAVVHAERDSYYRLDSAPNDPLFNQLWGLQSINASGAWDRTVGTPATVVADLDTGYRFEHPDLADVAWTNPLEAAGVSGIDDDDDGIVDDVHGADFIGTDPENLVVDGDPTDSDLAEGGHGVHTAGTIGAEGNNGIGITGVAQDVSLMPLRVCGPAGGESGCPASAIVEAINYAGLHGARVANMSFGGDERTVTVRDAMAANPQTLFVIAAGNQERDNEVTPHYPCMFDPLGEGVGAVDNVICVAATDQADHRAWFSNWGVNTVDLGAPGTEILSTFPVTRVFDEDFEADDFTAEWTDSGVDGGFARTDEAPLTSFGMSDSPAGAPQAGSVRASTSAPLTMPPGFYDCVLEQTRTVSGGQYWFEVLLDGETELGVSADTSGRFARRLKGDLSGGGELELRFEYKAGPDPGPGDGVWLDDIELHCTAQLGEPGGYAFMEGTSMATPHVTGAAALLFSEKPSASVTEVRRALLESVDPVPSMAGKTTSGGRLDVSAAMDLFDDAPPPAPSLDATSPPSPAGDNLPRLLGSAQPGTSIDIYANATCSGSPVESGTAAQLAGPGIAVGVGDGTVTEFSASATDMAPLSSTCSEPIAYTENSDVVSPPAPQLTATDPASPASSGTPGILGAAEAGSVVRVYAGSACAGPPVATGSAAELTSPGIPVQVAEGVTAVFSATATDVSDNTSACSAPISYSRLKATTDGGGGGGGGSTNGGGGGGSTDGGGGGGGAECVVPKLAGKTLAQAKAALNAASCKLGTLRKPRLRKGSHPPLVVKSSTPAAGAKPAAGRVNLTLGPKPSRAHR
jgi:subtilisin family serine protease